MVYVGGGTPKNFIQQSAVACYIFGREKPGHSYGVQITMDEPDWGGLSGCTFEEAQSWRKIAPEASFVTVRSEATIALPLIVSALAEGSAEAIRRRRPPAISFEGMEGAGGLRAPREDLWRDRALSSLPMADERFFPRTFAAIPEEYARFEAARVVILPVPYDHTASGLAGSREGPRAIIDASEEMELYDLELESEPYRVGIHTLPEVAPLAGDPAAMMDRIEALVGELLDAGKFVVTLGGEHTVAVGAARAYRRRFSEPVGTGAGRPRRPAARVPGHPLQPRLHPAPRPRVLPGGAGRPAKRRAGGARVHPPAGAAFFTVGAYRALTDGPAEVAARLTADVYVTIDLDALDPAEMAAVGTPEPGGLRWEEVTALLARVARERRIVGFDVTELAPRLGPFANAQLAAKLTYRLIGLALAEGP